MPVEDAEETYGHKEDIIAEELNRFIVIIFEEYARWPTLSFSCQTQEFRKWLITNFASGSYSFTAEELNRLIVIIFEEYARWPTLSFSCQKQEFRKWLITNFNIVLTLSQLNSDGSDVVP